MLQCQTPMFAEVGAALKVDFKCENRKSLNILSFLAWPLENIIEKP